MEIKPQKNYKKPTFAVGLASLMVTAGMTTGCTDNTNSTSDINKSNNESEVTLMGDMPMFTESTSEPLEYDGGLELVGEVEFTDNSSSPEETEILELEGDVVCPPDSNDE